MQTKTTVVCAAPYLGLRKCGTIGGFWEKPKKQIWQNVIDKERQISEGSEKSKVRKLVDYVLEWLGGTVPIKRIERSFGYWSDSPGVRDWANKLFSDEDDSTPDEWELLAEQEALEIEEVRGMRRQSRRMTFPKVSPLLRAYIAASYARLQSWCCRIFKPRPDPLSLHPP